MLTITLPKQEVWDEAAERFYDIPGATLQLEHSLLSISKWEMHTHKPFLDKKDKTTDEIKLYIRYMTINKNVDDRVYEMLTDEHYQIINSYISDPMTATSIPDGTSKGNAETPTSELIYYWMISFNIPFECQKWHLQRLLTLIRVCSYKNTDPKKRPRMTRAEMLRQREQLNNQRLAQFGTTG